MEAKQADQLAAPAGANARLTAELDKAKQERTEIKEEAYRTAVTYCGKLVLSLIEERGQSADVLDDDWKAVARRIKALTSAESELAAANERLARHPLKNGWGKNQLTINQLVDKLSACKDTDEFCDVIDAEFLYGAHGDWFTTDCPPHTLLKHIRGLVWACLKRKEQQPQIIRGGPGVVLPQGQYTRRPKGYAMWDAIIEVHAKNDRTTSLGDEYLRLPDRLPSPAPALNDSAVEGKAESAQEAAKRLEELRRQVFNWIEPSSDAIRGAFMELCDIIAEREGRG